MTDERTDEATGGLPLADLSAEDLRARMSRVVVQMNEVIKRLSVTEVDPPLSLDKMGASVRNIADAVDDNFRFEGSLEKGFMPESSDEPTAVVKSFKIPGRERRADSQFLEAWESILGSEGIRQFAVTNIANLDEMRFWEEHGYSPSGFVRESIPYAMIKRL